MKTKDQAALSEYQTETAMRNMTSTIDELQLTIDNLNQTLAQRQEEVEALTEALNQAKHDAQNQQNLIEEEVQILSEEESSKEEPTEEEVSGLDSTSTIPSAHSPLCFESTGENSDNRSPEPETPDQAVTSKPRPNLGNTYIVVGPRDEMLEALHRHGLTEEDVGPSHLGTSSP